MIICLCQGIREQDIRDAIQRGAHSISTLRHCTGAGTSCGACLQELKYLLHHHGKSALHYHEVEKRPGVQQAAPLQKKH